MYDITERKLAENALRTSEFELRLLSMQVMTAQEQERQRIAAELHDGIGQTLSAIKFSLENAIRHLADKPVEEGVQQMSTVIPKMQDAIEEVRRISMALRPSLLDDIGILATLTWFCRESASAYEHIRIESSINIKEEDIPQRSK